MDTTNKNKIDDEVRGDTGSESDAASGAKGSQSLEREIEGAAAKNRRFFRKRPKSGDGLGSFSDDELASARKIPTSMRGGGRNRGVGRGLTCQEAAQRAERLAAEGRQPGSISRRAVLSGSSGGELDSELDLESERTARFAEVVGAAIRDVALKRNKSSKDKAISAATASIMAAAEANHVGPSSDAMSEMRVEVARLNAEMELLQKENEKLRADLADLQGAGPREKPQGRTQHGQGQPLPAEDRVLNLVRQELAAFHSRFSVLEAIVLRPPLAASQQKATSFAAAAAAVAKPGSSGQANCGAMAEPAKSVLAKPVKSAPKRSGAAAQTARAPARAAGRPPQSLSPPESPAADAEWQVAGEKRKASKAARAAKRKVRRQRRKKQSVAARLHAPKSAAVVITLQPAAEKKGVSYREVLAKARAVVNLEELGVAEGIRVRVTATGARMLDVPGAPSGPTADALAERLRAA